MKNWKIHPENRTVARYIDCYWYIEKQSSDSGPDFPRLNPDPAAHLIVTDPETPYHYENETLSASGSGNHLIYPQNKTLIMNHSGEFRILGIKFQVGALYALRIPEHEIVLNQIACFNVPLFFGDKGFHGTDFLNTFSESPENCRTFLDNQLKDVLTDKYEDRHSKLVRNILELIPHTALSDTGEVLGVSQRTAQRSFSRVTGITLKQYLSMERFEMLLAHLYTLDAKSIDWADVALEFGFSDQPHLIRYLKSTIGHTPGEYARSRDLTIDAYGTFQ